MAIKPIRNMTKAELRDEYNKTRILGGADDDMMTSELAQARAIIQLTESKDPEILTHLTDLEIKKLSSLSVVADLWKSKVLSTWIKKFIRLRISLDREGRKEIVEIAKKPKVEQQGTGFRLFGRG